MPATYTLYRRQLLLLSHSQRQFLKTKTTGTPVTQLTFPQQEIDRLGLTGSYYQHYDVSAYWDDITVGLPNERRWRFNDLETISHRRNRFGMIRQDAVAPPAPGQDRELPFVPNGSAYDGGFHDTDDLWFGRPTLWETTHKGFPLNLTPATLPSPAREDANPNNAIDDAFDDETAPLTANRRSGEDILLTNVVSFDIKVFDDDFVMGSDPPGGFPSAAPYDTPPLVNRRNWPGYRTRAIAPVLASTIVVNPARDPSTVTAVLQRPEFVDLGYLGVRETSTYDLTPPIGYNPGPDPGPPYVDYGTQASARWRTSGRPGTVFGSGLDLNPVATYDTWCSQYPDRSNIPTNLHRYPPYERPLRGVQIKIRILEPKSNIVPSLPSCISSKIRPDRVAENQCEITQ